jgi:hypothetical protein
MAGNTVVMPSWLATCGAGTWAATMERASEEAACSEEGVAVFAYRTTPVEVQTLISGDKASAQALSLGKLREREVLARHFPGVVDDGASSIAHTHDSRPLGDLVCTCHAQSS